MIIGTETIEGEARAGVGRGMSGTGTMIEIIISVAGLAVLAPIMTGNIADTGVPIGDVLSFCFVLLIIFPSFFKY
uniref:Uncharacterized protein n=1 Tax=Arundo donax TaxID=35708 RepID=A0A0A9EDC1_ARUDO